MEPDDATGGSDSGPGGVAREWPVLQAAPESSAPEDLEFASVRRHLHLSLAGILLPVLSLLFIWPIALIDAFSTRSPKARALARISLILAFVDTLVALAVLWTYLDPSVLKAAPVSPGSTLRIGISGEPDPVAGVRVTSVASGSPADNAGLSAGDVIIAIDDIEVSSGEEIQRALNDRENRESREFVEGEYTVRLRRGEGSDSGAVTSVRIRPTRVTPPTRRVSFFEPVYARERESTIALLFDSVRRLLPALAILLAIAGFVGRRGWRSASPAILLLAALIGSVASGIVVSSAAEAITGGSSFGSEVLGMFAQSGALLLAMAVAVRKLPRRAERDRGNVGDVMSTGRAFGLGLLFDLALVLRAALLGIALTALLARAGESTDFSSPLEVFAAMQPPVLGLVFFFLAASVLAPIGEELAFRGFLQPWLRAYMGTATAIGLTSLVFALLHPQYGAFGLIAFAHGIVLGWARFRTGALVAPILLHAFVNSIATLVALLR